MIGFDGFVDSIISVVDKRHDLDRYDPIPTIADFGRRISAKAGQSSNYEMVVELEKLGGNGPIMANAMASGGADVSYVGCLGYPSIHPVFEEFSRVAETFSIAEPGYTDALEFDDGKLMMGKYQTVSQLSYTHLQEAVGGDMFAQLVHRSQLIGLTNWTMMDRIETVWKKIDELLGQEDSGRGNGERGGDEERKRKYIFVDLADPAKRTPEDIRRALELLSHMQGRANVVLGLNLSESTQALEVLGFAHPRRRGSQHCPHGRGDPGETRPARLRGPSPQRCGPGHAGRGRIDHPDAISRTFCRQTEAQHGGGRQLQRRVQPGVVSRALARRMFVHRRRHQWVLRA